MYDVIIIGKGPAGISASLYTKRAGLKTLIISLDDGALSKAEKIENYYGLARPVSGKNLLTRGVRQAKALGVEFKDGEVLSIDYDGNYSVVTKDGSFPSLSVIIASGVRRMKANINNLSFFEGKGVSYCAVCDAFFYRNKTVGVIGSGEFALHEMNALLPLAKEVTLFTDGNPLTAKFPENIKIITDKIQEIVGEQKVSGVKTTDGSYYDVDGLFIALGQAGADALAKKLGAKTADGKIITDNFKATQIPGVFAAGDCTEGLQQISKAVGDGAIAATSAIKYIKNLKNVQK